MAGNSRNKPRKPAKDDARASEPALKPGLAARIVAARILGAVIDKRTPLDGMLDAEHGNPAYRALGEADRALVRAIVHSSLRHLPQLEAMISALLQTPLPDGARALQHVLVTAAAQIVHLDVPDHSAVDLAVEQAHGDPRNRRFANLVNAVLRRLSREKDALLETIAANTPALPRWLMERLVAQYGAAAADAIGKAVAEPAALDLTVKGDAASWAARLGGRLLPTGSVRLGAVSGPVTALAGFAEGDWWVQDAAAALPARLFGALEGKRVVDLCAAPGGKTAQLVMAGASVTALDLSANRLRRLEGNLARLGLTATLLKADAARFETEDLFDGVLLDAPCSSTGTLRRHPDIPWTKTPEDIETLALLQERLLRHALALVVPGGRVVFANCSLDTREGEDVTARVLADTPGIARVPIAPRDWPGLEQAITPLGEFRTTPAMIAAEDGFAGGMDGFYAVVLRRTA
ncbi:RsmB/NOP family class I SAM-dependent RNA methyltransferase [Ciceribacter sp. sgz301302]